MQPAKTAHGAFLARPSWGPRKAGWLCGERRSSVVIELSCLHGSEGYTAYDDETKEVMNNEQRTKHKSEIIR